MFRAVMVGVATTMLAAATYLAQAQEEAVVPAHEEPRHVPKLVNEWVRIVDVEIPEGEQTLDHRHSLDYPYVLVTNVTLYNQVYGQQPQDAEMKAGFIGYYSTASQGAYTHRFINRGPGTFRAIGIELMRPANGQAKPPLPPIPGAETALDNERVGAYRIRLAPGTSIGPIRIPGPSVRVSMGTGRIADDIAGSARSTADLVPALFNFRDATVTTTISNVGNLPVELVEFVLK